MSVTSRRHPIRESSRLGTKAPKQTGIRTATNVRKRRRALEMTQHQLAEQMVDRGHHWTAGIVGFVERCDRNITVDELSDLAAVMGVSAWRLMGGDDMEPIHGS